MEPVRIPCDILVLEPAHVIQGDQGMNRNVILMCALLVVCGCATPTPPPYVVEDGTRMIEIPQTVSDPAASPAQEIGFEDVSMASRALGRKPQALTNAAVVEARTEDYLKNGAADVIVQPDNTRLYPYGLSQPRLTCAKMLFCIVELEKGEQVLDMASGDTVRWNTKVSYKGDESSFTAMVMVKPLVGSVTTNLSIVTDRRDYNILMTSVEAGEYMPRIGFYYPQDAAARVQIPSPPVRQPDMAGFSSLDVENIHFDYVFRGDKTLPWYPVSVFDDGKKVYIKMGEGAFRSELPVFHVRGAGGEIKVVNYRYRKPYFIVDSLFEQGELLLGSGTRQTRVMIQRKGTGR